MLGTWRSANGRRRSARVRLPNWRGGALLLFDKIVEKFRAPALALLNDPKLPLGRLRAVISSAPR